MKTKEERRLAHKVASRRYYLSHRKELLAVNKKWMEEHSGYRKAYTKSCSERKSVMAHHGFIFRDKSPSRNGYKGMPFFDAWNPDKGGSFYVAEKWIVDNLGRRPENTSLHIVDHSLGFVPGNLEWTHQRKQIGQQMFKIIAQQRNSIKKLEARILELETGTHDSLGNSPTLQSS